MNNNHLTTTTTTNKIKKNKNLPLQKTKRNICIFLLAILFIINNIIFYNYYLNTTTNTEGTTSSIETNNIFSNNKSPPNEYYYSSKSDSGGSKPNIHNNFVFEGKCNTTTTKYCLDKLWKGDALRILPNSSSTTTKKLLSFDVAIVISYCNEELDIFTDYINDNTDNDDSSITIKNITILSRCSSSSFTLAKIKKRMNSLPEATITVLQSSSSSSDLSYMDWILQNLQSSASKSTSASTKKNQIIVFLNHILKNKNTVRPLHAVVQSTLAYGFGCVQKPAQQYSYYHDSHILKTFLPSPGYSTFGTWLQHDIHISNASMIMQDSLLVPVCYGSAFAIVSPPRTTIHETHDVYTILKSIHTDSIQQPSNHPKKNEFIERVWASIFSYPLSNHQTRMLRTHATHTFLNNCCTYSGALIYDTEYKFTQMMRFWKGDTVKPEYASHTQSIQMTLVISYCNEDMTWMKRYIGSWDVQNVIIYSKCNHTIVGYTPPGATIISIPNVGRCDHTYAHYINTHFGPFTFTSTRNKENHLILFWTASHEGPMLFRSFDDTARIALESGFACSAEHRDDYLYYHYTNAVRTFELSGWKGGANQEEFKSNYLDMGDYLDELGIVLPQPYVPVCYGGNFMVQASNIVSVFQQTQEENKQRNIFQRMEDSLSRGDNIEEGHFVERTWAGLLSNPLTLHEIHLLRSADTVVHGDYYGYFGILKRS